MLSMFETNCHVGSTFATADSMSYNLSASESLLASGIDVSNIPDIQENSIADQGKHSLSVYDFPVNV